MDTTALMIKLSRNGNTRKITLTYVAVEAGVSRRAGADIPALGLRAVGTMLARVAFANVYL